MNMSTEDMVLPYSQIVNDIVLYQEVCIYVRVRLDPYSRCYSQSVSSD